MSGDLHIVEALQVLAAAIAGFLAGRGRVRAELDRLEAQLRDERTERARVELQLESTMRELAFTNALVVQLIGRDFQANPRDERDEAA